MRGLEDGGDHVDEVQEGGAGSCSMRAGQVMTIGLRVPPRWEATCLTHWNGVLPAQAQPTG